MEELTDTVERKIKELELLKEQGATETVELLEDGELHAIKIDSLLKRYYKLLEVSEERG